MASARRRWIPLLAANAAQEAQILVEADYEYVTDFGEVKLFKKRK
jgi:hypothetical protein